MKDIQQQISSAVKSKTIITGADETVEALLTKELSFVAYSSSCPPALKNRISYYAALSKVPCEVVGKSTLDLGSMCGKPYSVSAFGVLRK